MYKVTRNTEQTHTSISQHNYLILIYLCPSVILRHMQHQQLGFPNHPHCLYLKPGEEIQQNIIDHASLANNICGKRSSGLI